MLISLIGCTDAYMVCVSEWTRMCAGLSHAMEWKLHNA